MLLHLNKESPKISRVTVKLCVQERYKQWISSNNIFALLSFWGVKVGQGKEEKMMCITFSQTFKHLLSNLSTFSKPFRATKQTQCSMTVNLADSRHPEHLSAVLN